MKAYTFYYKIYFINKLIPKEYIIKRNKYVYNTIHSKEYAYKSYINIAKESVMIDKNIFAMEISDNKNFNNSIYISKSI